MNVLWILAILFVVVTFVFIALALMYPEWVGITGKVAKRMEAEQRGDLPPPETTPQDPPQK